MTDTWVWSDIYALRSIVTQLQQEAAQLRMEVAQFRSEAAILRRDQTELKLALDEARAKNKHLGDEIARLIAATDEANEG